MEYDEKSGGGSHTAPKLKYNEVEKFFPVSVDNFFDNPDRIVKYAKSLPKEPDSEGRWPGKRTKSLWEIDDELNRTLLLKIFSCYYDLTYQDISWESSELYFQEISTFSKNKNDVKNRGWIHTDATNNEVEVAGLIYLTPDSDPDTGTSLFKVKPHKEYVIDNRQIAKHLLYKKEEFDEAYYIKKYKEHEECFIEKTRFTNIYNRMIMYDSNEFHRANNFYNGDGNGDGKDARLTLVFFIGGLDAGTYPLEKLKIGEYDEFIERQCTLK